MNHQNQGQDKGMPKKEKNQARNTLPQWTEELEKMEVEYHELNVELIREELKGGQSDT